MSGRRLHEIRKEKKVNRKYIEEQMVSNDKRWRSVRKAVEAKFKGTEKAKLIELRYKKKLEPISICRQMNISQTTYYKWREDILNHAMLAAVHEGLIEL